MNGTILNSTKYATRNYGGEGELLWAVLSDEPGVYTWPCGIAVDEEGNVYVSGNTDDYFTLKYRDP